MTNPRAPLWAILAEAIDGAGDTHLPPGIHVRALPSPRLGVPATPLVVTRTVISPDSVKHSSRSSGVSWIDSHGVTLTPPFHVTPDNPVFGYFSVPNVIFAELDAVPAPAVNPPVGLPPVPPRAAPTSAADSPEDLGDVLRPARPTGAPRRIGLDLARVADVLEGLARIGLPLPFAGFIRFEAMANSELGPTPFQSRGAAPYALAAWTIPLVRVIGRGTVNGMIWLDAAAVDKGPAEQEKLWEIWSLPIDRPAPRYTPTANAPAEAAERIRRAAVRRQPLYVAYTAVGPAVAPVAAPADAMARVNQVRAKIDDWLGRLLHDGGPTTEAIDTQIISGASNGSIAVPIEPFLIGGAVDPDVGHYLGFGDDDVEHGAPNHALVLYHIRGLWRWDPRRWGRGEAAVFSGAFRRSPADAIKQFLELKRYGIAPTENGPFVDLSACAVALVGVPPSAPSPISFDTAEDRGWFASPPPPRVRRAVRLTASGFLPHPVAALAATDTNGDWTLNPYPTIGRHRTVGTPPQGTPLPIVVSRPGDAVLPGLGRFEDRDAPEGAVLYRLAQGDWFGRWGPWRTRNAPAKTRTQPMRPTLEVVAQPPANGAPPSTGPLAGTILVRTPLIRTDDLPAGGADLARLELDETFAGSAIATTSYALSALPPGATIEAHPAPAHDMLVMRRTGPSLQPSTTVQVTYQARWIDQLGMVSPDSDPAVRTIVDPRPPALPPVVTDLRYTSRPDAQGHARVDLDFGSTPGCRYRVYAATETTLLRALDAGGHAAEAADIRSADPGTPRAMKFRSYQTLFGWDHFECLTKQSIIATDSITHFVHRISGSHDVLAIYRVISEGESGALADLTQADLAIFAVPNLGAPARPHVTVLNANLDPTIQGARLRVKVPIGKASPKAWRLRRASVPTRDPLRMKVVAQGIVGQVDQASDGFVIDATDPLKPWRQYRFSVEVQADDPPGAPTVGVLLPGEWSEASAPVTLPVIPHDGPLPPSLVQIATVGSDLHVRIEHPAATSLGATAMGQHRFEFWRIEPDARPEQRNVLFTLDSTGAWVGSDPGAAPSGTYVTVRVIDPIGRRSDPVASNVIV